MMERRNLGILFIASMVLLVGCVAGLAWFRKPAETPMPTSPTLMSSSPDEKDEPLARQIQTFCGQACHAYPPPDTFPRKWWRKEVEQAYRFFERSALSLRAPSPEAVIRYYEELAPEEFPPAQVSSVKEATPVSFEQRRFAGPPVPERFRISHLNLVKLGKTAPMPSPRYVPDHHELAGPLDVLACDMLNGLILHLRPADANPAWKVLARVSNPARTEVIDLDGDGLQDILVADLGSFAPTDRRCGSVVWLKALPDGTYLPRTLLKDVGRVADVRAADFRGNGKLDLIVGVFGWQSTGEVILLENQTTDWSRPQFVSRVVDERHGAIHVPVTDLNGDGKLDFVALFAQEHEAVVGYLNDGKGGFQTRKLFSAPHPGYGSSGIELVDLNRDGRLDILYTNGDILDEPYLYKPYHGIQWLENLGEMNYRHHPITPMYGVHRAVAGKITGRDRMEILAVSFLPEDKFTDRQARHADAVVFLEQTATGNPCSFQRHSLVPHTCDHVCCAIGDLHGTGRMDLIVGNFNSKAAQEPAIIWKNQGPATRKSTGPPGKQDRPARP